MYVNLTGLLLQDLVAAAPRAGQDEAASGVGDRHAVIETVRVAPHGFAVDGLGAARDRLAGKRLRSREAVGLGRVAALAHACPERVLPFKRLPHGLDIVLASHALGLGNNGVGNNNGVGDNLLPGYKSVLRIGCLCLHQTMMPK